MDRHAIVEDRQRQVLRDWIGALPHAGWSGTVTDLFEELTQFLDGHEHRHGAYFPTGSALSKWLATVEDVFTAAGRQLGFTRTKHARLVVIAPAVASAAPARRPAPANRPAVGMRPGRTSGFGVLDMFED